MSDESNHSTAPDNSTPPPQPAPAEVPPSVQPTGSSISKEQADKKLIAGLFGILLGFLGIHKFYLGYTVEGIVMLVASIGGTAILCGLPLAPFAMGVVGLIEGILYLTKTDDEFVATYVVGRKGWF
jgi:TM2 domain-containing membrane protein YozV